jgi:hypothetical protein
MLTNEKKKLYSTLYFTNHNLSRIFFFFFTFLIKLLKFEMEKTILAATRKL